MVIGTKVTAFPSVSRGWEDNRRQGCLVQTIVELFLGLRLPSYFPSARLPFTDTLPLDEDSDVAESDTDEPFVSAARSQVLLSLPMCKCQLQYQFSLLLWVCMHILATVHGNLATGSAPKLVPQEGGHPRSVLSSTSRSAIFMRKEQESI